MTEQLWLDPPEMQAWTGYRQLRDVLDLAIARDLMSDSGLSDSDYHVLSTLSETTETTWHLRPLADRLGWSPSRLAHHLSRMQKRGLVERSDETVLRDAPIQLTSDGQQTIMAAAPAHVRSVRRHLINLLTPAQIGVLTDIANAVTQPVRSQVRTAKPE